MGPSEKIIHHIGVVWHIEIEKLAKLDMQLAITEVSLDDPCMRWIQEGNDQDL